MDLLLWVAGAVLAVYLAGIVGFYVLWLSRAPEVLNPPLAGQVIRAGARWPVLVLDRLFGD